MGGAGVASGTYLSASFLNPALLTQHYSLDDFAIVFPSIHIMLSNPDDLMDNIDDLQASYNYLDELLSTPIQDSNAIRKIASQLGNDFLILTNVEIELEGNIAFALSIPNKHLSMSLYAQSSFYLLSRVDIKNEDISSLSALALEINNIAINEYDLNNLNSSALLLGRVDTEMGVSLAKQFEWNTWQYSIGITPKYQYIQSYHYTLDVEIFNNSDYDDPKYQTDEGLFNIDLGFIFTFDPHWKMGLMGKNLIQKNYITQRINDHSFTYSIAPEWKIGLGYQSHFFSASLDFDLNEKKYFNLEGKSQFVRMGAEIKAVNWGAFRIGYRYDLSNNTRDFFTFGLGISPWDIFHLDITAIYANKNELGFSVQTSLMF
jgi:hypothetical protein